MTTSFVYKPITELLNIKKHFNQGFLGYLALWNVKSDVPVVVRLEDVAKNEKIIGRRQRMDTLWRKVLILLGKFPLSFIDRGFDYATVLNKTYFKAWIYSITGERNSSTYLVWLHPWPNQTRTHPPSLTSHIKHCSRLRVPLSKQVITVFDFFPFIKYFFSIMPTILNF